MPWYTSPTRGRDTLATLLSFPSPQPDMDQVRRYNRDCVTGLLSVATFDNVTIDGAGNLLATLRGEGSAKPFLLCFYAATYPQERMADAFSPRVVDGGPYGIEGECMVGRGTCEQKGALAAMVEAITTFASHRPALRREVILAVTVAGEMGSHEVVDAMVREYRIAPGAVLVSGVTGHDISLGNRGRVDVHVEIIGVSCHSSRPHQGRNAIEGARLFLTRLQKMRFDRVDPDVGNITLTPTHIETWPKAMHTVPSCCRITLDRRLLPGEEPEDAVQQLRDHVGQLGDFSIEINAGKFNYPGKSRPDCELVRNARRAVRSVVGQARTFHQTSTLDAGYFIHEGIDTIQMGPGDPRFAHSDFELVSLRQVEEAAEYYHRLLWLMCAERPDERG